MNGFQVTVPVVFTAVGPAVQGDVAAEFFYNPREPHTIRIIFAPHTPDSVVWLVARDTFRKGLTEESGLGDIRIWPSNWSGERLLLHLRTDKQILLEFSRRTAQEFLSMTDLAVPPAREDDFQDWDLELDLLLLDPLDP